ncbi:hypothetical protein H8E77_40000 [bacterium]|nr:hypothetical protein [bacterium]
MKGYLVRIGIDKTYGRWNAPVDPDNGKFVYVPIPEKHLFIDGLETRYFDFIPDLEKFAIDHNLDLYNDLKFPRGLIDANAHLDPDFRFLTYGDAGKGRGSGISKLDEGDFIAFYSGLQPIKITPDNLFYALTGLFVIHNILWTSEIPKNKFHENAHTRKVVISDSDIIVRAKPIVSGRLGKCIPIGERRNRAYRVRRDLLREWGGLSVRDGYIQRSRVPPHFLNPEKFLSWFKKQKPVFIEANNP